MSNQNSTTTPNPVKETEQKLLEPIYALYIAHGMTREQLKSCLSLVDDIIRVLTPTAEDYDTYINRKEKEHYASAEYGSDDESAVY